MNRAAWLILCSVAVVVLLAWWVDSRSGGVGAVAAKGGAGDANGGGAKFMCSLGGGGHGAAVAPIGDFVARLGQVFSQLVGLEILRTVRQGGGGTENHDGFLFLGIHG